MRGVLGLAALAFVATPASAQKMRPVHIFVFAFESRDDAAKGWARAVTEALESEVYGSPEWVQATDEALKAEPVDDGLKLAEQRKARAEKLLADGMARVRAQDDREAVSLLAEAEAQFEAAIAALGDLSGVESAVRERALAHFREGADREGERALTRLLALNPKALAGQAGLPPVITRIAERVRRAMGDPVTLRVSTTPPGATLFVDGIPRGTTPCEVKGLAIGTHYFRLLKERFLVAAGKVKLDHNGGTLKSELAPMPVPAGTWHAMLLRTKLRQGAWDESTRKAAIGVARAIGADALVFGSVGTASGQERKTADAAVALAAGQPVAKVRLLAIRKGLFVELGDVAPSAEPPARAVLPIVEKARQVIFPGLGDVVVGKVDKDVARLEKDLEREDVERAGGRVGRDRERPWYKQWWVWTLIGVAAGGGVLSGVLISRGQGSTGPSVSATWRVP